MENLCPISRIITLIFYLFCFTSFAQIGINNPDPDPSSLLDLKANDRGMLVPRLSSVDRANMLNSNIRPADALLVFDIDQRMFFFFDTVSIPHRWIAMNPWRSEGNDSVVFSTTATNIGIGVNNPTEKLEVRGKIKADTVIASQYTLNDHGNGPVPAGGIIMWAGSPSNIPAGWAVCDGSNGTPDLRGRFIVGYDYTDPDYNAIGKNGGEKSHTLNLSEIPNHTHSGTTSTDGDHNHGYQQSFQSSTGGKGTAAMDNNQPSTTTNAGAHTHSFTTNYGDFSGGRPHENRPPYFTLAYIMKLY